MLIRRCFGFKTQFVMVSKRWCVAVEERLMPRSHWYEFKYRLVCTGQQGLHCIVNGVMWMLHYVHVRRNNDIIIESKLSCVHFLPARRYASAGNSNCNVSVRPSVTRRYCVKTKKASGMISSPSDSPKTLVSDAKFHHQILRGSPRTGA